MKLLSSFFSGILRLRPLSSFLFFPLSPPLRCPGRGAKGKGWQERPATAFFSFSSPRPFHPFFFLFSPPFVEKPEREDEM